MKSITCIFSFFVLLLTSGNSAATTVVGYAHIDSEEGVTHSYNSTGGTVQLLHADPNAGYYSLAFEGVVSHHSKGYWQVTRKTAQPLTEDEPPGYCKVQATFVSGATRANIQCFDQYGQTPSSKHAFNALFIAETGEGSMSYGLAYFHASRTTVSEYSVGKYHGFNADREPITIQRISKGRYTATVPINFVEGNNGNVQIAAYGVGSAVCTLLDWRRLATINRMNIDVVCFDPANGQRRDSQFQALVLLPGGLSDHFAYSRVQLSSPNRRLYDRNRYWHNSISERRPEFYPSPDGPKPPSHYDFQFMSEMGGTDAIRGISFVTPVGPLALCWIAETQYHPYYDVEDDLWVYTRCTRSFGLNPQYSMLNLAPKEIHYLPGIQRKYLLSINVSRISEPKHGQCILPYTGYFRMKIGHSEIASALYAASAPQFDDETETMVVDLDWTFSAPVTADDRRSSRPGFFDPVVHITLERDLSDGSGSGCLPLSSPIDISPLGELKNLNLQVNLRTHVVTVANDHQIIFPESQAFNRVYIGNQSMEAGNEAVNSAAITFVINLERL